MGRQQGRHGKNGRGAFRSGNGEQGGGDAAGAGEKRGRDEWCTDSRNDNNLRSDVFERFYNKQRFGAVRGGVESVKSRGPVTSFVEDISDVYGTLKTSLPMAVRVNRNHPDRHAVKHLLQTLFEKNEFEYSATGVPAMQVPPTTTEDTTTTTAETKPYVAPIAFVPGGLALQAQLSRGELKRLHGFKELKKMIAAFNEGGYLTRQEAVSMIPPLMLDVQPGMTVLDMCAAPGSKTSQLLEALVAGGYSDAATTDAIQRSGTEAAVTSVAAALQRLDSFDTSAVCHPLPHNGGGCVIANDVNISRIDVLTHQTGRAPHSHPHLIITNNDATNFPLIADPANKFDRVLCDVMCSGDGTLRKSLDLWGRWNALQGADLHCAQLRTLLRGMSLVKKGGIVVYSTCSMNPVEDEAVVAEALLQSKGAFELIDQFGSDDSHLSPSFTEHLPGLRFSPGITEWWMSDKEALNFFNTYNEAVAFRRDVMKDKGFQYRPSMFPPTRAARSPPVPAPGAAPSVQQESDTLFAEDLNTLHLERCMRVLPHTQDTGGFFIAAFRCKEDFSIVSTNKFRRGKDADVESRRSDPVFVPVANTPLGVSLSASMELLPQHFPFEQLLVRRDTLAGMDPTTGENQELQLRAAAPRVLKLFLASRTAATLLQKLPPSVNVKQVGVKAFESYVKHAADKLRVNAEAADTVAGFFRAHMAAANNAAGATAPSASKSFFVVAGGRDDVQWLMELYEQKQGRALLSDLLPHMRVIRAVNTSTPSSQWTCGEAPVATTEEWLQLVAKKSFTIYAPFFATTTTAVADPVADAPAKMADPMGAFSPVCVSAELDDSSSYVNIKILPHVLTLLKFHMDGTLLTPETEKSNTKDRPDQDGKSDNDE